MSKANAVPLLTLTLCIAAFACARTEHFAAAAVSYEEQAGESQSATVTIQSFTTVDGPDLTARLEAAASRARSAQTPYWSAYAFDVRPGVAIDPNVREFHGSMSTIGDSTVFVGSTASGMTVETRNLAIFLLRDPGNNQVKRMEVYNLERKREYTGYPVYWLGRANNGESLDFMQKLADLPSSLLSERVVLGIALHDDQRVSGMLKNFVRTSQNQRIRSTSVYWLGQVGSEHEFLSALVRNEAEDEKVRRQAAHAIGESRDRGALAVLQTLYDTVKEVEVRRSIINAVGNNAVGNNSERDAAIAFLFKVARSDAETHVRRAAVHRLGQFESPALAAELMKVYSSVAEIEVKRAVMHALSETKSPGAAAQLLSLAKTEPNLELKKRAIRQVAERGESAIADLFALYDSESSVEVRRTVLQSLGDSKSTRVEDKLFEVARQNRNVELRRQAIRLLGERAGKRSLDFLSETAQTAEGNTEVQMQAVRAISERKAEEAVPLLIKIAKTHSNQLVRKQAIRALGESGDPRAIEYFREVLGKD